MKEFITTLHVFENFKEQLIRDLIVVGIANQELGRQLKYIIGLMLQKAIDSIRVNEDVAKQQDVACSSNGGNQTNQYFQR